MSSIDIFLDPVLPTDPVIIGRVTSVHGIKGWVKIYSYTEEPKKIFDYEPWWINAREGWKLVKVNKYKVASQNLIAHINNFDDRDISRKELCQRNIAIDRSKLPKLNTSEYYWYQLKGLRVITINEKVDLGVVVGLLETGANEVLEIQGDRSSLDLRQRLIPCIKQVVLSVNLESNIIQVDWDPEF